jgi:hypothetical protein
MALSKKLARHWAFLMGLNDRVEQPFLLPFEVEIAVPGSTYKPRAYEVSSSINIFVLGIAGFVQMTPSDPGAPGFHIDPMVRALEAVDVQIRATPPATELFANPIPLSHLVSEIGTADFRPLTLPIPWRVQHDALIQPVFRSEAVGIEPGTRVGITLFCDRISDAGLTEGVELAMQRSAGA